MVLSHNDHLVPGDLPELCWKLLRDSGWWTDCRKGGCTIRWLTCSLSDTLASWRTLTWEEEGEVLLTRSGQPVGQGQQSI